jgi:hypothetical protein
MTKLENLLGKNSGLTVTFSTLNKALVLIVLLSGANLSAQEKSFSWYSANFPKERAIKLIDETNIVIELDKQNNLVVYRNLNEEKLLLNNTANGFQEGEIMYSSFFNIREVAAAAYLPKGSGFSKKSIKEFKTEKIMSDQVFHDDQMAIKFQYPELREGAKISLSYTEDILNPFFLPPVFLQDNFFAEKIRVTLRVPEAVTVKINNHNLPEGYVNYSTKVESKGSITHIWEVDSVKQYQGEGGAPNPKYFVPHLSFIIQGYNIGTTESPVLRNVADLYTWYSSLLGHVDATLPEDVIHAIDSISAKNPTELGKAKALFNWVRSRIKYIAVEDGLGGFIPDNPSSVATKRFGDCKGMSCLLANMMRYAGLNARECWIGTRDIPYSYEEVYTPFVDNHMITAFNYQGTWLFLDATDEFVPFGYPSSFIQGKEALIGLPEGKYTLQRVPEVAAKNNAVTITDTLQINADALEGKATSTMSGYAASRFKRLYRQTEKKDRFLNYYLASGNDKYSITKEPTITTGDTVVSMKYAFKLPDYVKEFDGKYMINLNADRILADNTFEDRKLPVERDNLQTYVYNHYLKIPKGYKVAALPENFVHSSILAKANITYVEKNGFVQYSFSLHIEQLMMEVADINAWNDLVKDLRKEYRRNIELEKIK